MVPLRTDPIDACFEALERAIERDPELSRELAEGRDEFFRGRAAIQDPGEKALADRRLLEWFLLERERSGAAEARVAALLDRCARTTGESAPEVARALAESHASVFEVSEVD